MGPVYRKESDGRTIYKGFACVKQLLLKNGHAHSWRRRLDLLCDGLHCVRDIKRNRASLPSRGLDFQLQSVGIDVEDRIALLGYTVLRERLPVLERMDHAVRFIDQSDVVRR